MTDPSTTLPQAVTTIYDVVARAEWPRAWFVALIATFVGTSVYVARRGLNVYVRDERKFDKDDAGKNGRS